MLTADQCYRELRFGKLTVNYSKYFTSTPTTAVLLPFYLNDVIDDNGAFDVFKSCGMNYTMTRLFYWPYESSYVWHMDACAQAKETSEFAINWVLTEVGEMQFRSNMPAKNSDQFHLTLNDFEISTKASCYIANVMIPHRIILKENTPRITISLMFDTSMTYQDAVDLLSDAGMIK